MAIPTFNDLTPMGDVRTKILNPLITTVNTLDTNSNTLVKKIDGVESFNALRSRVPAYSGERVMLREYNANAAVRDIGGGWFIGNLTSLADDGGYVASSGSNYHWIREKDIEDLDIGDFGGVADGVTDTKPAFKSFLEFLIGPVARLRTGGTKSGNTVTGGSSPYLPIRYGSGTYFQTPGEYNKYGAVAWSDEQKALNPSGYQASSGIRIEGAETSFGRLITTKIISDKTNSPVFLINHRRFTVRNISWDGQQTTAKNAYNKDSNPTGTNLLVGATSLLDQSQYASNTQPFIKNECPSGCYMKLENLQFSNTGGYGIYVLDTLDSKVNEVFSSNTAAPWLQTGWSDPKAIYTGAWDHSTSIEISNINCSSPMGPALWLPRVGQGIMRNVWFEHGNTPFDINNGQWDMSMVCIEDCTKNPIAWNCKFSVITLSVPTGNNIDTYSPSSGNWNSYTKNPDGSDITAWSEGYGQGNWKLMNHTAQFNCPVLSQSQRGILRFENNTDATLWVNIGSFMSPTNGSNWKIRIVGGSYYNTSSVQNMLTDRLLGETVINVGRGVGSTPKINFYNIGGGVVVAAPVYKPQPYNTTIPEIWVPIRSRVGECAVFVEQTGLVRNEAGVPSSYTLSGATQTTAPTGMTTIPGRFSFNTNQAGFGANGDVVEVTTRRATVASQPVDSSTPVQFMRVSVNGQELAMPIYAFIPKYTTNTPTTLSVATGDTLTLTTVVTDAVAYQWQLSTDNGTTWTNISGATSQVYSKTSVTSSDSGRYRLSSRSNNGSGGAGATTGTSYSNVTTVTIT